MPVFAVVGATEQSIITACQQYLAVGCQRTQGMPAKGMAEPLPVEACIIGPVELAIGHRGKQATPAIQGQQIQHLEPGQRTATPDPRTLVIRTTPDPHIRGRPERMAIAGIEEQPIYVL